MKHTLFTLSLFVLSASFMKGQTTIKILFDASKAETCSNADWIPDADTHNLGFSGGPASVGGGNESNPQRFPTPAQSGVTASTPETFWQGALSAWGIDCAKRNYQVETLPYNGAITFNNPANVQDLSNYKIFVVDEPNIVFTAAEKTAIMNWVAAGGGLFMISDHDMSDRNNDGWDSPHIWNDFMSNNTVNSNNPFGITYDLMNFSESSSNVAVNANDSCLHGPMGNCTQVKWSNGTSMTLDPTKNSTVKASVYQTAAGSTHGNTQVMFAQALYGKGKVAAMGDSSPPDDGTGDPNDALYNGYFTDAAGNHQILIMNATIWLATNNGGPLGLHSELPSVSDLSFFPNPTQDVANLRFHLNSSEQISISVCDLVGREVKKINDSQLQAGENGFTFSVSDLPAGVYIYKINGPTVSDMGKFMVSPR